MTSDAAWGELFLHMTVRCDNTSSQPCFLSLPTGWLDRYVALAATTVGCACAASLLLGWQFCSYVADRGDARRAAAQQWADGAVARKEFLARYVAECEVRESAQPNPAVLVHRSAHLRACVQDVADAYAQQLGIAPEEAAALGAVMDDAARSVDVPASLTWALPHVGLNRQRP